MGAMEDLKTKRLANAEATTKQDYISDLIGGYKPSQGIFWNSGRPDPAETAAASDAALNAPGTGGLPAFPAAQPAFPNGPPLQPGMEGANPFGPVTLAKPAFAPGPSLPQQPQFAPGGLSLPPVKGAPITPMAAQFAADPQSAFMARLFGPEKALELSKDVTNVVLPDGSRRTVPKYAVSSLPAGSQIAESAKAFDPSDIAFVQNPDKSISGINKANLPAAIARGAKPLSQDDVDLLNPSVFGQKVALAQAPSQALPATFEPTAQKAAAEANEGFAKDLEAQASQARTGLGDLELLRQARAKFKQSGALGEYAGKLSQLASAMGVKDADTSAGAAQLLDALATKMGITYRPPGTRMTQIEFQKFRQAVPGITMNDDPADIAIAMKEAEYNHAIQTNSKIQGARGPNGALPGNIKSQITPFQDALSDEQKAIARKFGITTKQAQAAAAPVAGAQQPPAGIPPDAKLGTDPQGNPGWYSPDPSRPGKFVFHGPAKQ